MNGLIMKKFSKIAVIGLLASGFLGFAHTSTVIAAPKSSPTLKGSLPKGKPFQYLNARIDSLQAQINKLIGQVSSLEAWQAKAEAALITLQKNTADNAAAIALLTSELDNIKSILDTKQDIITGTCPDGQYVYEISQSPSTLICRADLGANGLTAFTVQTTQEIAANSSAVVAAECPTGSVPSGGSYEATPGLTITASGIANNGYSVDAANTTGAALTLNVTGTCVGVAP